MADSQLLARLLARVPIWLYASSQSPELPLIAARGDEALLRMRHPELLPAAVVVDDREAVCSALCAGAGQGLLPAFLGEPPRREGRLHRLSEEPTSVIPVHAVFAPEQRGDPRLRALLGLIEAELAGLL